MTTASASADEPALLPAHQDIHLHVKSLSFDESIGGKELPPVTQKVTQHITRVFDEPRSIAPETAYPYVKPVPATEGGKPMSDKPDATAKSGTDWGFRAFVAGLVILAIFIGGLALHQLGILFPKGGAQADLIAPPMPERVVTGPPAATPQPGRVVHNAEFDNGQAYCDKYVNVPLGKQTKFAYWIGNGAARLAHCE